MAIKHVQNHPKLVGSVRILHKRRVVATHMRQITIISFLFIFVTSCSTNKESGNQLTSSELETSELSTVREIQGDKIELRLSEQDTENKEFELVADNFYTKFIEPNGAFRKQSDSYEQGGVGTHHYYYGLTHHNGNCLILVYEYFILNHSEDKLFLLAINSEGQLATTIQVAELTGFPGGHQRTYSYLDQNRLRVISVTEEILGPYNEETNKYQYIKDSITTDYNVESWSNIETLKSDSIKGVEYWK